MTRLRRITRAFPHAMTRAFGDDPGVPPSTIKRLLASKEAENDLYDPDIWPEDDALNRWGCEDIECRTCYGRPFQG